MKDFVKKQIYLKTQLFEFNQENTITAKKKNLETEVESDTKHCIKYRNFT